MSRAEVIARLKAVEPQLRAHGVAALYLFGSYAHDEAGEDSDLDVFVDPANEQAFGFNDFADAYLLLEREFAGHEIGYSTRSGLHALYRPEIERTALRVF